MVTLLFVICLSLTIGALHSDLLKALLNTKSDYYYCYSIRRPTYYAFILYASCIEGAVEVVPRTLKLCK